MGELDLAPGSFAGRLLCVDALEFHQGIAVGLETVLLDEERYENIVDAENQIVSIHTVEHIIIEEETDFPSYAVRLAELAYSIYVFSPNHSTLFTNHSTLHTPHSSTSYNLRA